MKLTPTYEALANYNFSHVSEMAKIIFEFGYFNTDYCSYCPICEKYYKSSDEIDYVEICDKCKNRISKLHPFTAKKIKKIEVQSYTKFKKIRKKLNIQMDQPPCPKCNDLLYLMVEELNYDDDIIRLLCPNPNCDIYSVCYYFKKCGNIDTEEGELDGQFYSPNGAETCKECIKTCNCEMTDKYKITKVSPTCIIHNKFE